MQSYCTCLRKCALFGCPAWCVQWLSQLDFIPEHTTPVSFIHVNMGHPARPPPQFCFFICCVEDKWPQIPVHWQAVHHSPLVCWSLGVVCGAERWSLFEPGPRVCSRDGVPCCPPSQQEQAGDATNLHQGMSCLSCHPLQPMSFKLCIFFSFS